MLVFATKSNVRISLLKNAGYQFETIPARISERDIESNASHDLADQPALTTRLAAAKAEHVSAGNPDMLVIGADQTLKFKGSLLHKPENRAALHLQLDHLKGNTHDLCSAAVIVKNGTIIWEHAAMAKMKMRDFADIERDRIVKLDGDKLLQSVGGYRLEGPSIRLFEEIEGDYFTILGLPLLPLVHALDHLMDRS